MISLTCPKTPIRSAFQYTAPYLSVILQFGERRCCARMVGASYAANPGFTMADGRIFLETHHIVPLSEGGNDSAKNVAAVCANCHREAHLGARAAVIRETLLQRVRRALNSKKSNTPVHPTASLLAPV